MRRPSSFLLVFVMIVSITSCLAGRLNQLGQPIVTNLLLPAVLDSAPSLEYLEPYWTGAGLRSLSSDQLLRLLARQINSNIQGNCAEWEKAPLNRFSGLLEKVEFTRGEGSLLRLTEARRLECNGNIFDAQGYLAESEGVVDVANISFLRRHGSDADAFKRALEYYCPGREEWCVNYFREVWVPGSNSENTTIVNFFTNATEEQLAHVNMLPVGPLLQSSASNLEIERSEPIVVKGITEGSRDNYIQYETLQITGSTVRFNVVGEVLGTGLNNCLRPRLAFFSDDEYIREPAPTYQVSGRFEVAYWLAVPEQATTLLPRISFIESCFQDDERIVIYAVDLAFGP